MHPNARPQTVTVSERFQKRYRYELVCAAGRHFDEGFEPDLTPSEMLRLGVFGGAYFVGVEGGVPREFPKSWWDGVSLSEDGEKRAEYNYFKERASQPLSVWREKGWINEECDPHGWFQWYCRYYRGRRIVEEDERQITRWRQMRRHVAQVTKNCETGDYACRPAQRQALLHWAYDARRM